MKKLTALTVVVLAMQTVAAKTITVEHPTVSPAGGDYEWVYPATQKNGVLEAGSGMITIYDFVGFTGIADTVAPAGWTLNVQDTGVTPPLVSALDNPSVVNLTWTYSGTTVETDTASSFAIGNFIARSSYGSQALGWYTTQDKTLPTSTLPSAVSGSVGRVGVPIAPQASLPDGGMTVVMLGSGLLGLMAFRKKLA